MSRKFIFALSALAMTASAAPALAGTEIEISKTDCQRIVRYQPSADVEYRGGVDVHGNKVAPADVDGPRPTIRLPDKITIDIGVDLGKRFGIGDSGTQYTSETTVGKVTFDRRSGQVTFNGQPIGNAYTNAIAAKCRELLSKGR